MIGSGDWLRVALEVVGMGVIPIGAFLVRVAMRQANHQERLQTVEARLDSRDGMIEDVKRNLHSLEVVVNRIDARLEMMLRDQRGIE